MRTLELLCLIPILALIGGWNTIPKATYKEFNAKAPDLDGYQKCNLARSLVAVKISPQSDTRVVASGKGAKGAIEESRSRYARLYLSNLNTGTR